MTPTLALYIGGTTALVLLLFIVGLILAAILTGKKGN